MSRGCYSTFLCFPADSRFLDELSRREFSTVVLATDSPDELTLAKAITQRQPEVKLVLLGTDEAAVEGYSLNAHYCAQSEPCAADLEYISTVIFPPIQV